MRYKKITDVFYNNGHFEVLVYFKGTKIFLEVRENNIPARNLYKKCGFVEIRKIVDYYNNPKENGIMMLKEVV